MIKKTITVVVVLLITTISCKRGVSAPKIKQENLEKAIDRDRNIKGTPKITFDKKVYDFGTVPEGEVVETTFKVTNTGESDLIIKEANASCGCTVPTWTKKPIEPGESGEIAVKFDTGGKPNKQSKSVTLVTNTESGSETIRISGMVTPKNK